MRTHKVGINRRRWVVAVALASAASLAAACGSGNAEDDGGPQEGEQGHQGEGSGAALPNFVPITYVEPDIPGVDGSTPGYTSVPEEFVKAYESPPGSGGTYTAMTPLWGTIPPTTGNQYFDAVNEAMGTTIEFQISDGNTYGDKLAASLASPRDLADWVTIPGWNVPPRFGDAVESIFEDLTPYLGGDTVEAYPNLAAVPTGAWQACSWNGKLFGIPQPSEFISDVAFYRADILGDDVDLPTDSDEMIEFLQEHTTDEHWGANDLWTFATQIFSVPPEWVLGDDGELVHRVETQEYRDALEWIAEVYAAGVVHPDAVADNQAEGKQRFESGNVVVTIDGIGAWHEALARVLPTNPDYIQQPIPAFAADGGEPLLYKNAQAGLCSYLKANDDPAVIEELLQAADFLASPFGTEEFQLINYGLEGVHYTLDEDRLPVATDLAVTEVQPTYIFLAAPAPVNARVQYPGFVESYSTWMADLAPHLEEPLFYGQNITVPNQYASLAQPFEDLEKDIARGRKSLADLDAAIETWRSSGGEELRAFYQDIYDAQQGEG